MDACIVDRIEADPELDEGVHSVVRYGSFERGDFVAGLSDLDYFAVVDDDDVAHRLLSVLEDCAAPVDVREVDLAWEYPENVGDRDAGVPFKCLTVYQTDFRRHHAVVYGEDVVATLPVRTFEEELPRRFDRLERLADEVEEDRMVRILAGETARQRARFEGAGSLRKDDVRETLAAEGPDDALRVYEAYLDGEDLDPAFCRRFVVEQVAAMRDEVGGA